MGGRKEEWMPKYYTISQIRFELWKRKAKEIKQDIILELFFDEDFFFFARCPTWDQARRTGSQLILKSPELPNGFQGRVFKGNLRGEVVECEICL